VRRYLELQCTMFSWAPFLFNIRDGDLFSAWGFFNFGCAAAVPQLLLWHCHCTIHTQNGHPYIMYLWMWHSYLSSQKGHLYHTTSWY